MDLRDLRVTVMGLGIHGGGVGAAAYFARHGSRVTATDLKDAEALAPSVKALRGLPVHLVLGEHRNEDFQRSDLIIRSPAVPETSPLLQFARSKAISVETDASLACHLLLCASSCKAGLSSLPLPSLPASCFMIGISGTKGKTTTASLVTEAWRALTIPVALAGIPGTSFLDTLHYIEQKRSSAVLVAELSSWQLETLTPHAVSPPIALLTNLFPDHLNRHGTMQAYQNAKSALFRFQKAEDVLIVPEADRGVWESHLGYGAIRTIGVHETAKVPPLRIAGDHNRMNAALALAAVETALAHPQFPRDCHPRERSLKRARAAIAKFPGINGRLQEIAVWEQRRFVNDTTATNPGAAIAALASCNGPLILIAGGVDKDLPYEALAECIASRVKHLVLLDGSASEKLAALLPESSRFKTPRWNRMEDAVEAAFRVSAPGDTILFSPAAASFNLFQDEFARGAAFNEAVKKLAEKHA
ncbi:MAG: UDP-N-acetylmuramoylalanine--D-glutamate ligase [Candidatus Terrybacteria bacterium RIFCSPLOWO2_01_FULL_58_14]|uniref:UDP-N-acetylmuramoylalanine--D-glutamate ligase n=2 Tax=Candidatus Terryibacteriota TaxID=1817920 RepID=A0A1G2PYA8_9BACT|nr:MAG: UDP-N-acetylmuramoylalanine--D-glutamate ligase [Candidatus Terrybacteria bacterium RIFCSPHIGHO2_01_FULL_58_15]OHA52611.1 MAG: UDP-N-acetylmuramoylalanine--D-glutamate ligase [Candidatus Terrybacteria bacterium RIFCSPLOWO2_01_FULL_58_14]